MKERRETSFRLIDKYATYMPQKSWEAGKIGGREAKKLIADRQNNRGSAFLIDNFKSTISNPEATQILQLFISFY